MLDHTSPTQSHRPLLWPALVIALLGCPVASTGAAVLGCLAALGSLSHANFVESASVGAIGGALGGVVIAALASAFRPHALAVGVVGSLIVASVIGGLLHTIVASIASC